MDVSKRLCDSRECGRASGGRNKFRVGAFGSIEESTRSAKPVAQVNHVSRDLSIDNEIKLWSLESQDITE